jgi:hypothetical protein
VLKVPVNYTGFSEYVKNKVLLPEEFIHNAMQ